MFSLSYCSDEKKRQLYDEYGSFGLYIAEQVGDDLVGSVMVFQSGWFKVSLFLTWHQLRDEHTASKLVSCT